MNILVRNGPNSSMPGLRAPAGCGRTAYADLCAMIGNRGKAIGVDGCPEAMDSLAGGAL